MTVHGWSLFVHPLFEDQLQRLTKQVETLARKDPQHYRDHAASKLLATINHYIRELIPRDPGAAPFRQGNTLGADNRHWFRAKFHERYRLFYRFSSKEKVIIYVWIDNENTLRKAGAKSDPYYVFRGMLESGNPPQSMSALLARASENKEVKAQITGVAAHSCQ